MQTSPKFWNRIAERYARRPIADEATYRTKLETTRQYLRPDMRVLELGCGTGTTALLHAEYVRHIEALDVSAAMLEIARRRAEEQGIENVRFVEGAIEEVGVPDTPFGAVLALNVLHLLDDIGAALARIHQLLEPQGVFVSSTACIGDMSGLFRWILPLARVTGFAPYVRVFSGRELRDWIENAGFRIEHEWRPQPKKAVFIVARRVA